MSEIGASRQDLHTPSLAPDYLSQKDPLSSTFSGLKCRRLIVVSIRRFFVFLLIVAAVVGWYFGTKSKSGQFGLFFYPKSQDTDSTVIWVNNEADKHFYSNELFKHISRYENSRQVGENYLDCSNMQSCSPYADKVCRFNLYNLGNSCVLQLRYGYHDLTPCILLVLKLPNGFRPIPFRVNDTDLPEQLENLDFLDPWHIPVTCEGLHSVDKDNIGYVEITPSNGFPLHFFPYHGQDHYLPPLVFVQLVKPVHSVALTIKCSAWARNFNEGTYSTVFSILVD